MCDLGVRGEGVSTLNIDSVTPAFSQGLRTYRIFGHHVLTTSALLGLSVRFGPCPASKALLKSFVRCCLRSWSLVLVDLHLFDFSRYLVNLWKGEMANAHDQSFMFKQNSYHSLFN